MKIVGVVLLIWVLSGCLPDDERVMPYDRGDLVDQSVEMGGDYESQLFFDLSSQKVVGKLSKMDWDLALSAEKDSFYLSLNSGRLMQAAATGETDFAAVSSASGWNFTWDDEGGNLQKGVFADWQDWNGQVYVIDLGYDPLGQPMGFKKMQILGADEDGFELRVADLDGSSEMLLNIPKEEERIWVRASIRGSGSVLPSEPARSEWDLLFSSYTATLWDGSDSIAYLVTGVLLNSRETRVSLDSSDFAQLGAEDLHNREWSTALNAIGYDWKYYDFDAGSYLIVPNLHYLIQDSEGFYYKLRFIDFYDDNGVKGAPRFEYQKL